MATDSTPTDTLTHIFDDFCGFADRCVFFLEAAACVHLVEDGMNPDVHAGLSRQSQHFQDEIRAMQSRLRQLHRRQRKAAEEASSTE